MAVAFLHLSGSSLLILPGAYLIYLDFQVALVDRASDRSYHSCSSLTSLNVTSF